MKAPHSFSMRSIKGRVTKSYLKGKVQSLQSIASEAGSSHPQFFFFYINHFSKIKMKQWNRQKRTPLVLLTSNASKT